MELFNVGILEIVFIAILALVLFGPNDLINNMRKAGGWIYKVVKSPYWRTFMDVQQEIREMPTKIIREAGLEESLKEAKLTAEEFNKRNILDDRGNGPQGRSATPIEHVPSRPSMDEADEGQSSILPPDTKQTGYPEVEE